MLVGDPCKTCVRWDRSPSTPTIGYCGRGYGWQKPAEREWDCKEHLPAGSLEANIIALDYALVWLRIALDYYNGTNAGTPTDPRHYHSDEMMKPHEIRKRFVETGRRLKVLLHGV